MEFNLDGLTVVCYGNVIRPTKSSWDARHGNWIPGDPPDCSDFKVYLENKKESVEITKFIDVDALESLKNDYIDAILEG